MCLGFAVPLNKTGFTFHSRSGLSLDAPEAVSRCEDMGVRKQGSSTLVLVTSTILDLKLENLKKLISLNYTDAY